VKTIGIAGAMVMAQSLVDNKIMTSYKHIMKSLMGMYQVLAKK
jgi:hypothetical protein